MSTKISQLPLATSPVAPDVVLPVVQDGVTKKASIDQLGFLPAGTGAVTRTIQNKLRTTPYPTDYTTNADYVAACLALKTDQNFAQNGAIIHRLTDRLFIGDAIENDGAFPNVAQDWLTQYQIAWGLGGGTLSSSLGAALTEPVDSSACAFLFGSQSKYFTNAGTSCLGATSIVVNDNTTHSTDAWAFYGEAHRVTSASGSVYAIEIDVRTLFASILATPAQQGESIGLQIGAGCGLTSVGQFDCSAAIQIVANPVKWKTGINFMNDSLVAGASAVAMGTSQFLRWYNTSGDATGAITTTNTSASAFSEMRFMSNGVQFLGSTGQALAYVFTIPNAVNSIGITPAVTGSPVIVAATGSDTNIDIFIAPQGTGVMRVGTFTSNADAPVTGYITIKDAAGNIRKLATIA
jgi:hypothetical protein